MLNYRDGVGGVIFELSPKNSSILLNPKRALSLGRYSNLGERPFSHS